MALYLLLSMPLAVLLVSSLALSGSLPAAGPRDSVALLARCFFVGIIAALPSQLVLLALDPLLGRSYRPGRLYFSSLLADHGLPLLLAATSYGVVYVVPIALKSRNELTSFAETVAFLGGFLSVVAVAEFIGHRRESTGHLLFLLPTLRLVSVVVYAKALDRLASSRGSRRVLPAAAMVAWPSLAAFEGLWQRMGRVGAATIFSLGAAMLCAAAFAAALGGRPAKRGPQPG